MGYYVRVPVLSASQQSLRFNLQCRGHTDTDTHTQARALAHSLTHSLTHTHIANIHANVYAQAQGWRPWVMSRPMEQTGGMRWSAVSAASKF
eukprot:3073875-Amphidinium_carterae.1